MTGRCGRGSDGVVFPRAPMRGTGKGKVGPPPTTIVGTAASDGVVRERRPPTLLVVVHCGGP